jgi:hypothetical protein
VKINLGSSTIATFAIGTLEESKFNSSSTPTVPEPASLAVLGTGLLDLERSADGDDRATRMMERVRARSSDGAFRSVRPIQTPPDLTTTAPPPSPTGRFGVPAMPRGQRLSRLYASRRAF